MNTKIKLLLFVAGMLLLLGIATIINVSLNFRDYSLKSATQKATMAAEIVKDGLTAHMVNGIMDKRQYFLDQISTNNSQIQKLWIVRSPNVTKQYGKGFSNEVVRDALDKDVLKNGKTVKKFIENSQESILRISIPYNATVSNRINCLSCHDVKLGTTLGAVSMEFNISAMRSSGIYTILKILAINLLFVIIALFLINYFVSPYLNLFEDMQRGIKRAYRGDFTHKFVTTIQQDAPREIVKQLNILFGKMQNTFGDIKNNLSSFVPQGCSNTTDPLQEANSIIHELSEIYKFKKTIEFDTTKEIIYERFIQVLEEKFQLKNFSFFEINATKDTMNLIYNRSDNNCCILPDYDKKQVIPAAHLCRAFRTDMDVLSSDFKNICKECEHNGMEYLCIPFTINDEFSLVLTIHTANTSQLATLNSIYNASIKNYLEAAKPVIESRLLLAKLRENALHDPMTNLYNRRFLEEFIDTLAGQIKREEESYSILMFDVDFFKMVNDTYGHDVGDKVIAAIGKVLRENIRESDLAIRYGGEEFLVLLHNADEKGTMEVAKKIHSAFASISFDTGDGGTFQKTMSIGISIFPKDANTIWKCIKFADTALYVAKTTGRNKIVRFDKKMTEQEELR